MKKNKIVVFVMCVSVLISLAFVGCGQSYLMVEADVENSAQSEFLASGGDAEYGSAKNSETDVQGDAASKNNPGTEIFVQIAGAISNPGVYALNEGARVYELVEKAGGLTLDADDTDLNQAAVLSDGTKIYIFHEGERTAEENQEILSGFSGWSATGNNSTGDGGYVAGGTGTGGGTNSLVNINTADETLLCTLPGIGATRATAIITYRTENGRFKNIEDIMLVPGIKDSVYSKVKDYIKV